ncbi:MAG: Rid family detoxifying hydrolase [Fervidicoccaceae archaeon]
MIKVVYTKDAPKPIGPYSQGILIDNLSCNDGKACSLLFISGMVPIDPQTGQPISGNIEEQTRRCLLNVKAVVEAAGGRLEDIVKVTVFLSDISNFDAFNKAYSEIMGEHKPARSVVSAKPPKNFEVEIEAVALIKK